MATPKKPSDTATPAAKAPAPRKPATPRKASGTTARTAETPAAARKTSAKKTAAPRKPSTGTAKSTAKKDTTGWSKVAIAGGVAAVGAAATAALFALRGSTAVSDLLDPGERAHQADGTDSSASFEAGIADEGTIPA